MESKMTPQAKYDASNTKKFCLKLNLNTDKDILDKLMECKAGEGMQTYIKRLIREDMERA